METLSPQHLLIVKIKGQPEIFWKDWFENAVIYHTEDGNLRLTVQIQDQSALLGVLISLHNLGLEIIYIEDCRDKALSAERERMV